MTCNRSPKNEYTPSIGKCLEGMRCRNTRNRPTKVGTLTSISQIYGANTIYTTTQHEQNIQPRHSSSQLEELFHYIHVKDLSVEQWMI